MRLTTQRRLAAEVMGIGVNRVWINPQLKEDVSGAITKEDIRRLIKDGTIKARPVQGISRARAKRIKNQRKKGRRRGPGKRKGRAGARLSRKDSWIRRIRPIRAQLRGFRENGKITPSQYRSLYLMANGGQFKSKAHLLAHMKEAGMLKEENA